MQFISNFRIAQRVLAVVIMLAVVAAAVGAVSIAALDQYERQTDRMELLSRRANLLEQVNGLIYATVMDSRGVYMSATTSDAARFAKPMVENLARIRRLVGDIEAITDSDQRVEFNSLKSVVDQYITFRTELARLGTEVDPAKGREYGDNDANRANRTALNRLVDATAKRYDQQIAEMHEQLNRFYAGWRRAMIFGIVLGIALSLGLALYIVLGTITRPLAALTLATTSLAGGNAKTEIPGTGRKDEIGDIAAALQVFKTNLIAKEETDSRLQQHYADRDRQLKTQQAEELAAGEQIADLCRKISAGDLSVRMDESNRKGYFLVVSQQLNHLAETLQTVTNELASVMEAIARGDLSRRISSDFLGVFGKLKDSANGTATRLQEFASRLEATAEGVRSGSSEISVGSQDLAHRTESQAAMIEQTAASMQEVTTTVKLNADNAQNANQLAAVARDTAEKGGVVTQEAVEAVSQIEESARKISDIVGLIDEIAFQTNLLALNASVEAARAGEAGKGFAVVAQEVRSLAQRSASASKEIKTLISASNAQVKTGAALVNQTGNSLGEIVSAIKKVADIVAEIAAASREQATGLDQINTAVGSMDEMTQRNAALVEETTAAAQSLAGQSHELAELAGFFRAGGSRTAASAVPAPPPAARPAAALAPKPAPAGPTAKPTAVPVPKPAPPPARRPAPAAAPRPQPTPAAATHATDDDDDWKEF